MPLGYDYRVRFRYQFGTTRRRVARAISLAFMLGVLLSLRVSSFPVFLVVAIGACSAMLVIMLDVARTGDIVIGEDNPLANDTRLWVVGVLAVRAWLLKALAVVAGALLFPLVGVFTLRHS